MLAHPRQKLSQGMIPKELEQKGAFREARATGHFPTYHDLHQNCTALFESFFDRERRASCDPSPYQPLTQKDNYTHLDFRKSSVVIMLIILLVLGASVSVQPLPLLDGKVVSPSIKIYTLSPPIRVPIPPPPMCSTKVRDSESSQVVALTLWRSIPSEVISVGTIFSKRHVVTSCEVTFFGSKSKSISGSSELKVWPADCSLKGIRLLRLDESVDLTTEPAYSCKWNSIQTLESERMYATLVNVYLSPRGRLLADNREWEPTTTDGLWISGLSLLAAQVDASDLCAFEPIKTFYGTLQPSQNHSQIFVSKEDALRVVLEADHILAECRSTHLRLYPTDLGIPVSLNYTIPETSNEIPRMSPFLDPSNAVFRAEIMSALAGVTTKINHNFETLDFYLCQMRKIEWENAMRSPDAHNLAHYITRDPFSLGNFSDGKLLIRIRVLLPWVVTLDDVRLTPNGSIEFQYNSSVHSLDAASGLVDYHHPRSLMMPPLVELADGKLIDLRDSRGASGDEYRWVHSELAIRKINLTVPPPEGAKISRIYQEGPTRYEGFLDRLHLVMMGVGSLSTALFIGIACCCFRKQIIRFFCLRLAPDLNTVDRGDQVELRPIPQPSSPRRRHSSVLVPSRSRTPSRSPSPARLARRPRLRARRMSSPASRTPRTPGWMTASLIASRACDNPTAADNPGLED